MFNKFHEKCDDKHNDQRDDQRTLHFHFDAIDNWIESNILRRKILHTSLFYIFHSFY